MRNFFLFSFSLLDQIAIIWEQTLIGVGSAVIFVFIALILALHPIVALFVMLCVVFIYVNVYGMVGWFDITLNATPFTSLLMGIGLSVDYCVHVGTAFIMNEGKNSLIRTKKGIAVIGHSIFNGSITTLIGVLVLLFKPSPIARSFVFLVISIIVFGLFYSLTVLPILLRLFGPKFYEDDPKPHNTVAKFSPLSKKTKMIVVIALVIVFLIFIGLILTPLWIQISNDEVDSLLDE